MPAVDLQRRPALNGFTRDLSNMRAEAESSSGTAAAVAVPSIEMPDAQPIEPEGTNYDDLNGGLYTLEQCVTPPPEIPLRQKLIGTWKLESYTAYPTPTSTIQRPTYPMTKNVTGFIMYTPDGYMSAQFLIPGQQSFRRGTGEEAQWAEAGKRFFAYSGPYSSAMKVTDEKRSYDIRSKCVTYPAGLATSKYEHAVSKRTVRCSCSAARSPQRSR